MVVEVNGRLHRLANVGGLAGLTEDVPCNIPQLGWWQFDSVPAGPVELLYPDFVEPINFVAPEAPVATPTAGPP